MQRKSGCRDKGGCRGKGGCELWFLNTVMISYCDQPASRVVIRLVDQDSFYLSKVGEVIVIANEDKRVIITLLNCMLWSASMVKSESNLKPQTL